jgi:HlyD family secretion protein
VKRRRLLWGGIALAVAALAATGYVVSTRANGGARYRTARVDRGPIAVTVSATGNLNAVTTVQVGSQVSGQIKDLYVDFNSSVKKGQLIARLDPDPFQAKVNAARADVENAQANALNQRANVAKARSDIENTRAGVVTAEANAAKGQADVENARAAVATARANVVRDTATMANAKLQLDRNVDLLKKELIAQSDKDQVQTAYDTARAQVDATQAQERAAAAALRSAEGQLLASQSQIKAAQAQVASAQAALQVAEAQFKASEATVRNKQASLAQAQFDLEHSEIRAPVNGVVISRAIDVGQTVAASLQAPTLFTIAEDLTRMQVEAAIDEADVGRLAESMPATFTVDAFQGRSFRGQIVQIRKSPLVVQNVVTYTTIIAVGNPDGILMPGMTANVRIQVERKDDVLRVPTVALRFRPPGPAGASGTTPAAATPPASTGGGSTSAEGGGQRRGGGAGGGADAGGPGGGLRGMRESLVRDLALTAEQQTRLDAILDEARQAFAARRAQGGGQSAAQGGDEAAREAQRRRARAELQDKIRAILTPDQQKKYEAVVAVQGGGGRGTVARSAPGRVYIVGADAKLTPADIVTGATDGTFVEVLSGSVSAGQEVATGLATSSGSAGGGTGGPRLRL